MSGQFSINVYVGLFSINGVFQNISHSIKLRESFDLHLKLILGKWVHLEHPFAYKVSLQSMHAERLGLTNGETFIS